MNIVLVVIDTARGDVTNSMFTEGELPNIGELADTGAVFTNAHANGPWTVPSHASMFTGKYPSQAEIHGGSPEYDSVPLVEELNDRNFETAGFSANPWLNTEFGFDKPFDTFHDDLDRHKDGASVRRLFGIRNQPKKVVGEYLNELQEKQFLHSVQNAAFWAYQRMFRRDSGGAYLLSRAGEWLSRGDQRFAFVNVTEPHLKYKIPKEWLPDGIDRDTLRSVQQDTTLHNAGVKKISEDDLEILRKTYRATLRYTDSRVADLVKRAGKETVFIIVGDHGEHFGEHGRFGHQYSLYEELLHVPLVISGPGIESTKVEDAVELRSLYGFIISLADEQVRLPEPSAHHIAETVSPTPTVDRLKKKGSGACPEYVLKYGDGARCISKDDQKLIEFSDGLTELVRGDAEEVSRLRSIIADECGEIGKSQQSELNDVSESTKARLDDLGYL
jgi:arylsulfatase A-like enzyme